MKLPVMFEMTPLGWETMKPAVFHVTVESCHAMPTQGSRPKTCSTVPSEAAETPPTATVRESMTLVAPAAELSPPVV